MAEQAGGSAVVVNAALSQLGKPYSWDTPISATNPDPPTFDCSGLTMWCYRKAGIKLTHFTGTQYAQLKHRPLSEAEPGDLVFFGTLGNIYHVALYIGNSTIIEAPTYGIPVRKRVIGPTTTDIMRNVGVFPGSQNASGQPATYQDFFTDVLTRLGYPVTQANLRALATVTVIEGPNDRYNPLNSVVPYGASTSFNSVGVQDYGTYDAGVGGTVALLQGTTWTGVDSALQAGTSESAVVNAFANAYASWGSHPAFGSVGVSRADSQLTQSIGTKSGPGSNIKPPYTLAQFNAISKTGKLTAIQKARMIRFVHQVTNAVDQIDRGSLTIGGSDGPYLKALPLKTDVDVTIAYMLAYNSWQNLGSGTVTLPGKGAISDIVDWTTSLSKIADWLSSAKNWERIGLFALGAIILIFAAWETFK